MSLDTLLSPSCVVFTVPYSALVMENDSLAMSGVVQIIAFLCFRFGGYVLMSGADPFGTHEVLDENTDPETAFMQKPVWKRILIVLAGPTFNLMLPICTFTLLLMSGEMQPNQSSVR